MICYRCVGVVKCERSFNCSISVCFLLLFCLKHLCVGFVPDVIGVVKVCNDISTVIGKQSQKEITKRDLQIVDQSAVAISLTLWGNDVSTHLHT